MIRTQTRILHQINPYKIQKLRENMCVCDSYSQCKLVNLHTGSQASHRTKTLPGPLPALTDNLWILWQMHKQQLCHDTTDRGWTQLEPILDWVCGVLQGIVLFRQRVAWPGWLCDCVVSTRLPFAVLPGFDLETGIRDRMSSSEEL